MTQLTALEEWTAIREENAAIRAKFSEALILLRAVHTACSYDTEEQAEKGEWSLPSDVLIPILIFLKEQK